MLARFIGKRRAWLKIILGLLAGFVCIAAAGVVAPSNKRVAMFVLAAIYGLYWMSEGRKIALVTNQRVDWLFEATTLGGFVAAFS